MGEMIKFGIKLAMIIAAAIGLTAAILTLYQLIISGLSGLSAAGFILEMFGAISILLPFNMNLIMTCITGLMSFRIAYWASDKLIEFIGATS